MDGNKNAANRLGKPRRLPLGFGAPIRIDTVGVRQELAQESLTPY